MGNKERIEYIDLMKGICILLVLMNHSCLLTSLNRSVDFFINCTTGRMPLYFALSGLFFKDYGSFRVFFQRKFRMLVIPILFFGPAGGILVDTVPWCEYSLDFITRPTRWVCYLSSYINAPLWFLRAIFIGSLMMYGIKRITERGGKYELLGGLVIVAGAYLVYLLSPLFNGDNVLANKIVLRTGVANAISMLPFMYFANLAAKYGLLRLKRDDLKVRLLVIGILAVSAFLCYALKGYMTHWFCALFTGTFSWTYLITFIYACLLWSFSFLVVKVPYVSYIGRYSLIVLVTHDPILRAMLSSGVGVWPATLVTLALMPIIIYLCIRYIPWACAQPVRKKNLSAEIA